MKFSLYAASTVQALLQNRPINQLIFAVAQNEDQGNGWTDSKVTFALEYLQDSPHNPR